MEHEDYLNWLKTLQVGDKVGVRNDRVGIIFTKEIVTISPRGIIELNGWKQKFRKGINGTGYTIVPLTENFVKELTAKKETIDKDKQIESLEDEINELKNLLRKETLEDKNQRYQKFIDDAAPDKYSTMRISTSVKSDILCEKEGNESLEKIMSRILGEVREYRQILGEIMTTLEQDEGPAEQKVENIKKSLGM